MICHKGVTYITKWRDTTEMTIAQFAETSIIVKNSPIQDNRTIIFHLIVCFEFQIRKTFWTPVSASPVISFSSLCLICTLLCLPATVWKPILWTGSNLCTQKIRTHAYLNMTCRFFGKDFTLNAVTCLNVRILLKPLRYFSRFCWKIRWVQSGICENSAFWLAQKSPKQPQGVPASLSIPDVAGNNPYWATNNW